MEHSRTILSGVWGGEGTAAMGGRQPITSQAILPYYSVPVIKKPSQNSLTLFQHPDIVIS
jgi:hypothetical protein